MVKTYLWGILLMLLLYFVTKEASSARECSANNFSKSSAVTLIIDCKKNKTGKWVTTFSAERDSTGAAADMKMVVSRNVTEYEERSKVKLQGVIIELDTEFEVLRFHPKTGNNAQVTNNGRSVEKINLDERLDGVSFTNRPLKDDELFELRIDNKTSKFNTAIGIGVMENSPNKLDDGNQFYALKKGKWWIFNSRVFKDGSVIKRNFAKEMNEIQVGERVGVKRTTSGDLHLFINGEDQGVAATDIPSQVYGVFELYGNAAKATIIEQ